MAKGTGIMKHYFGQFGGRLAGIPNWSGGHLYTADIHLQKKIEKHPYFSNGMITVVSDGDKKESTTVGSVDWESYVKSLKWKDLRSLAKSKGIDGFGKKADQLIAELLALE